MLYHFHELQHAASAPLLAAAETHRFLFSHPLNPMSHTTPGRAWAAAWDLLESGLRRYPKPDFALPTVEIDGRRIAVDEHVVLETPFCELRHFRRAISRPDDPRVLLAAPMSGHFATLLRGTVAALLPDHDVYITDWRDARDMPLSDGPFDLDDYIDHVIRFLNHLGAGCHVIAVCQPSVPVLAATALMAEDGSAAVPRSLVLMGGPIDTRVNPQAPNLFAKQRSLAWFEKQLISRVSALYPGFMRAVYPGFLQLSGFMAMNMDRHVNAHVRYFGHLVEGDGDEADAHRRFYREYRAVMDLPAEYYLQTVDRVFQRHLLALGRFCYRERPICPEAIEGTALMTVEGELDDISGVGQTRAAHDLLARVKPDQHAHYEQPGVGHYGVFNGRRWREQIAPRIKAFIRRHD